jgi:hypothetical protein
MANEYPKKYWWLVLIVVPVMLAIISTLPQIRQSLGADSTITGITVVPRQVTLQVGKSARLNAEAHTSSGAVRPGISLQWESVDPSIVSVSSTGMLTALDEGQTQVLAKHGRLTATAYITVTSPPITPAPPSNVPPVPSERSREEILKLTAVGIEYIRRVDLSFVQSHARLPFFYARAMFGTRESLNALLSDSTAAVRRLVQLADLVKVTAHPVRDLRSRDWFPSVTSFIPIPIEETDWAALIGTKFSQQPSAFTTWVAFFRSEEGTWKLLGISGGEGLLE